MERIGTPLWNRRFAPGPFRALGQGATSVDRRRKRPTQFWGGATLSVAYRTGTKLNLRRTLTRAMAASTVAALFLVVASVATGDPPTDPCGVLREADAAHAFGFQHARKTSFAVQRPGNSAGVVRVRCRVTAWDGRMPSGRHQERLKMADREMASLRIESWVPDWDGHVDRWKAAFPSKIKGLTERSRSQFLGRLKGSVLPLPKEGVPHALAFAARVGGLHKSRAFWWDHRGTILSVNAVQGVSNAAVPSLRRLVRDLVRPFFKG